MTNVKLNQNSLLQANNLKYTWGDYALLTALSNKGTDQSINLDALGGLSVNGGRIKTQIDHFNDGSSEKMMLKFMEAGAATTASGTIKVTLSDFANNDSGQTGAHERAVVRALDANGVEVGKFTLTAGQGTEVADDQYQYSLNVGTHKVASLEFSATSYSNGLVNAKGNSSDYMLKALEFTTNTTTSPTPTPTPVPNQTYSPGADNSIGGDDIGSVSGAVVLRAGDDIQAAINTHTAGTTFFLTKGVYYGADELEAKDGMKFIGEGDGDDVVLKGSKTYDSSKWVSENGMWTLKGVHLADHNALVASLDTETQGTETTRTRQDLFINDQLYKRVATLGELSKGEFYQSGDKIFISGDNASPKGSVTELGYHNYAFKNGGDNVTLQNFTIEHYANTHHSGAVDIRYVSGWQLLDMNVDYNHGVGLNAGLNTLVSGGSYSNNGQMGIQISADAPNTTVNDAIVFGNNYADYRTGWSAGGIKYAGTDNTTLQNNYVAANIGMGMWADVGQTNSHVTGNHTILNGWMGSDFEIGKSGSVAEFNVGVRNGFLKSEWLWGSQFSVRNTNDSDLKHNLAIVDANYGDGIAAINSDRGGTAITGNKYTYNAEVTDNSVVYLGKTGTSGFALNHTTTTPVNTTFANNQYIVDDTTTKHWQYDTPTGPRAGGSTTTSPTKYGYEAGSDVDVTSPDAYVRSIGLDIYLNTQAPTAIQGSVNNDTITGTVNNDLIMGGKGNDLIFGGAGKDVIMDGKGADTIIGGAGIDFIQLGEGADVVYFGGKNDVGDTIFKFDHIEDKLDVDAVLKDYGKTYADLRLEQVNLYHQNLVLENGATDVVVAQFLQTETALKLTDIHWI